MAMKCPKCGALLLEEEKPLTLETLSSVISLTGKEFSAISEALIYRVLKLTTNASAYTALKFFIKVNKFSPEEIAYGLSRFFEEGYHTSGYEWHWACGMIQRENEYKRQQLKKKLNPLPKSI